MTGDWWNTETVADAKTRGVNGAEESVAARMTETCMTPLLQLAGQ